MLCWQTGPSEAFRIFISTHFRRLMMFLMHASSLRTWPCPATPRRIANATGPPYGRLHPLAETSGVNSPRERPGLELNRECQFGLLCRRNNVADGEIPRLKPSARDALPNICVRLSLETS